MGKRHRAASWLEQLAAFQVLLYVLPCPQNRAHLFLRCEHELVVYVFRPGARPVAVAEQRFACRDAGPRELDDGVERVATPDLRFSADEGTGAGSSNSTQCAGNAVPG